MNFNSFKNEPFTLEDIFNDSTYQFSNKELIKSVKNENFEDEMFGKKKKN